MKKSAAILLVLIVISSCSNEQTRTIEKNDVKSLPLVQKQTKTAVGAKIEIAKDSISLPNFEIILELTAAAKQRLKQNNESIIVKAMFSDLQIYGQENEGLTEFEGLFLGSHEVEIRKKNIAIFNNIKLPTKNFDRISDLNIEVLLNVYSGRHSRNMNILDCYSMRVMIDSVKDKPLIIKCK